jgi:hypothetical protein
MNSNTLFIKKDGIKKATLLQVAVFLEPLCTRYILSL